VVQYKLSGYTQAGFTVSVTCCWPQACFHHRTIKTIDKR